MQENTFIGMGRNPDGPDLPEGLGMRLAEDPKAMENFGRLTKEQKYSLISYMQSATTGEDSLNRVMGAVKMLHENRVNEII